MADDYNVEADNDFAPPAPGWSPELDQIVQATPAAPGVEKAATYLNDYVQKRDIADANHAAGENFVNDMQSFQQGLMHFVSSDPNIHSLTAAMNAVEPIVREGGIPEEHHDAIIAGAHGELATAAVTAAAERDAGLARTMLSSDKVQAVLPEGAADSLHNYINMQDGARKLDAHMQQRVQAQAADARDNQMLYNYAAQLQNDDTGSTVFPSTFMQRVLADRSVNPRDTAQLQQIYGRLAVDGGAKESDPFTVHQIVDGDDIKARDVLANVVSGDLSMKDALHLAAMVGDPTQAGQAHRDGLSNLLSTGRTAILGADPIAGAKAFGRFTNWLLPQYEQIGPDAGNPEHPSYLLRNGVQQFMPTAADLVPSAPPANRPSLREIFGQVKAVPLGPSEPRMRGGDYYDKDGRLIAGDYSDTGTKGESLARGGWSQLSERAAPGADYYDKDGRLVVHSGVPMMSAAEHNAQIDAAGKTKPDLGYDPADHPSARVGDNGPGGYTQADVDAYQARQEAARQVVYVARGSRSTVRTRRGRR